MLSLDEIRKAAEADSGDKVNEHLDYLFEISSKEQSKNFKITLILNISTLIVAIATLIATIIPLFLK